MKRSILWILCVLMLMTCCSTDFTSSTAGSLVKKTEIKWHHTKNCLGHSDVIEKVTFELEGHEMWLLLIRNKEGYTIIHSPECPKCKTAQSSTTETTSDYWGW